MSYLPEPSGWTFTDDRGHVVAALRRPARVVAYIQAGAALADLGVPPIGVFGSAHDRADAPDPVKAGPLAESGVTYYGAGEGLDLDAVLADRPDLVVGVSHAAGQVYGIPVPATKYLEEQVPLAVLDVGQAHPLARVRGRFGELARALGAPDSPAADAELAAAERRLTDAAATSAYRRVLALSPADGRTVHLARPHTWPDLADLTRLGLPLVEPPQAGGINWSTTAWQEAAALEPDLVLVDARAHAAPLGDHLRHGIPAVPWNPEPAPSARAHARFLDVVARAVRGS